MTQYITQEQATALAECYALPKGLGKPNWSVIFNAAIQHYIDSLPKSEPVAWADDNAMAGKVGNVCSTAAKQYWEKSDWVDRKRAELHKHPLYTSPQPALSKEDMVKVLEALESNRVMARDSSGNYFAEVTPKRTIEAITIMQSAIERMK